MAPGSRVADSRPLPSVSHTAHAGCLQATPRPRCMKGAVRAGEPGVRACLVGGRALDAAPRNGLGGGRGGGISSGGGRPHRHRPPLSHLAPGSGAGGRCFTSLPVAYRHRRRPVLTRPSLLQRTPTHHPPPPPYPRPVLPSTQPTRLRNDAAHLLPTSLPPTQPPRPLPRPRSRHPPPPRACRACARGQQAGANASRPGAGTPFPPPHVTPAHGSGRGGGRGHRQAGSSSPRRGQRGRRGGQRTPPPLLPHARRGGVRARRRGTPAGGGCDTRNARRRPNHCGEGGGGRVGRGRAAVATYRCCRHRYRRRSPHHHRRPPPPPLLSLPLPLQLQPPPLPQPPTAATIAAAACTRQHSSAARHCWARTAAEGRFAVAENGGSGGGRQFMSRDGKKTAEVRGGEGGGLERGASGCSRLAPGEARGAMRMLFSLSFTGERMGARAEAQCSIFSVGISY